MKLLLCLLLCATCGRSVDANSSKSSSALATQRAEVAKLRNELNAAFEEGEAEPEGIIVQPAWTRHGNTPNAGASPTPSQVVVNHSALKAAQAIRSEINQAVAKQGQTDEVRQLEASIKARTGGDQRQVIVASAREEMLGSSRADSHQANVVDAAPMDIDLAQLQQLELSKRRTREMLVLSRIVEDLHFTLGADVSQWLQLQQNGSVYFVGRRSKDLLLIQQQTLAGAADFQAFEPLQTVPMPAGIDVMHSYERWNAKAQLQESLVLVVTEQQLLWYRLQEGVGLTQFWHWPLGNQISKLLPFAVESREYLVLVDNQTLSTYAYDVDGLEFWIVQRLQLEQAITALAVLDTGRDLLLAVGQENEALIYAHNMHQHLTHNSGLQLQLRQRLEAPKIADIAAFQMGGRSYLALGGQRPQILAYVQGQLLPKTVLGQNFGLVELFLPVPVRSYRDDLLLLVQHRVYFDTHTLLQLEVLIWNGEAFEASLPAPCELGTQTRHGAGCMLDEQRDAGLDGAALLRQMQPPLLLVPRQSAPSGLFRLHTQLLPRNSELHDLQEIHDFMRDWVDGQDKLLQLAERLLHAPEPELMQYDELSTPVLINEGALVEALHVNEVPWTTEDAGMNLHELLQQMHVLKEQIQSMNSGRAKRQQQLFRYDYDQLDFDVVEVQELSIDKLNDVPFYIRNATLQFNGSINVQRLELLQPRVAESPEPLPSSSMERLQLSGDLSCEYINGLKWTQFMRELVWRQEPLQLSQLRIQGAVVFEDSLHLSALNELSFPSDYLWSQGSSTSIVHVPKQFTQTLSANAVDVMGINGLDPLDAITLSDAQDWPGWVTFTQLEVSEELELNGSAQGRQFEEAPLNPTLSESHHIQAACHFAQLFVNGPLHLRGLLDNNSYDSLLGDLAQRPADANEELLIPAAKHVQQLTLPVDAHVTDGKLSGIPIEHFVTKHTEQTLRNLSSLSGYVYFHRLNLSGFYDGVALDQLLGQALRVDAPLAAPSTQLHFTQQLQLPQLSVTRTLNDVPLAGASGYQTLNEPLHLSQARFERLQAEQLDVTRNVIGEGRLNGRQLDELLTSEPQMDHVQVEELILPMGVRASQLQGLNADFLLGFLSQLDELPLLILHGKLQVEQIAVSGSVLVDGALNGRDLAQLQREVVWLDQPNELRTRWLFEQPPEFASDLLLRGSFNERLLPELLDDIVFRSDQAEELLIVGTKNFAGDVRVLDTLQLQALNGVPFERLANRLQPLNFVGDLRLEGQLHVTQLKLQGELNGQAVSQLDEQLHWQPKLGAFVHRGMLRFPQMELQELTVLGYLGNRSLEPLPEFFDDVLDKRQAQLRLESHKVFTGRVSIQGGAYIEQLNHIQLEQLLQELIFIDGKEVTLHSPVHFAAPVQMNELHVEQLVFQSELLNGCNVSEWIHDTLRVDRDWQAERPVTFSQGSLDNNALLVSQLNDLELSRVVTLHTAQNLSYPLIAKEVHLYDGHVQLQGLVNEHNLTEEYANTLLINAPHEQRVETPLVMQSVHVSGSLETSSPINGDPNLNLSDVATLHEEEMRLQTPLYFAQLHAPELRTDLHINGFDFRTWHKNSLWAQGRATQVISGNWRVRWLRVKQPDHHVYRRQTAALSEQYQELCQNLARLVGMLHLPYRVTQLRRRFTLNQAAGHNDLRRAFSLESPTKAVSFLLLNELGCWTRIYRWNGMHYASAGSFESGPVDEAVVLKLQNDTTNEQFSFMTSYELSEEQQERSWNCSGMANLQSWRTGAQIEIEPLGVPAPMLRQLQQEHEARQQQEHVPSYQNAIKYLNRVSIESHLRPHLDAKHAVSREQFETLRERLLQHLGFCLQTEVNITQLSIPESDLYDDAHLVEDFLRLMRQLELHASRSGSEVFASLPTDTLPLPNSPARVLAARSAQLIWPVMEELKALQDRLSGSDGQTEEQQRALILQLEHTVRDVLLLANNGSHMANPDEDDNTARLHAVIARLRQMQQEQLQLLDHIAVASRMQVQSLPLPEHQWRPVQTIRLHVGPAQHARMLYARLSIVAFDTPPTASAAYIQLHYANGSLFQSLAVHHQARQLTALRVRDETLLAFIEGCCLIRVFIYRGIQGFVPFAQFQAETDANAKEAPFVLQLLALRLPLQQLPGTLYMLAVVQARRVDFYELVIPGLFEPWLQCT